VHKHSADIMHAKETQGCRELSSTDCVKVLNEFASANEDRKTHFGKF